MIFPEEENIYQLLNELEDACHCTETICLYCQAAETIDDLIVQNLINQYRNKQHTRRCRRWYNQN